MHAYPDASYDMAEVPSKDCFIDYLGDPDIKWRVYQAKPNTLSEADVVAD